MTPRIRAVSLPLLLSALVFFMVLPVHAGAATDTLAAAQDHESDETTTQGICGRDAGIQTMIIDALTYGGATPTCEEVTADDLATITSLYSHRAYVSSLQPGDLDGLTRLKSLRIRKPGLITELPNGFFADTPNLKQLVLSYQKIRELLVGIFDDVPQLIVLDLYDNELTTLPDNVFEHTPNLFYLNLSGNKLTVIGKDTLDDVQALSTLYLGANQLTEIPEDLFNSHANLRKLELERNQITALSEDTFDGLSQLTELDLSGNELTTLPEDVFEGLSSLTTLEIYGNPITSVPADVFEGLTNLTRLSINLPNVSSDSFKDVQQVNNLSVIIGSRSISEDSFHELTNLERLDLFYGDLSALPADTFNGLTDLKHLNLSRNELTSLDEDIFDGLTGLEELKLSGNELTNLDEDIFDGLTSLEILPLGDNKFNTLPANLFADLAQLKSLSITNSELQTLPVGAFNGLQAVEHINLAVNHLRSMPAGLFEGITKLRYLGMQQLQISTPVEPPTWAGEHGLDPDMFAIRTGDETLIFEVQPELVQGDQIVARIIQGAPFDVIVTLSAEGGTLSTNQVTIPAGSINSAPITVTPVSADEGQVTVTITSAIFEGWNTFEDPAGSCNCWGFRTGPGDDITVDVTFPTISGMPQVGQELTADTSGIADNDGLDNVSYSYQWLADDANIPGETTSTYALVTNDVGKAIKVKVSFTDDAGNQETRTSAAMGTVEAAPPTIPGAPTIDSLTLDTRDPEEIGPPSYALLTVAWSAPADNGGSVITSYDLRVFPRHIPSNLPDKPVAEWSVLEDIWDSGDLELPLTELVKGVNYEIQVRAVNTSGYGPWSTGARKTFASAPGRIEVLPFSDDGAITVTQGKRVDDGGSSLTAYDVRYIRRDAPDKADANWTLLRNLEPNPIWKTLEYTVSGLTNGVWYDLQGRAVNAVGAGPWSETFQQRPAGNPSAPVLDQVTGGDRTLTPGWRRPTSDGGVGIVDYTWCYIRSDAPNKLGRYWTCGSYAGYGFGPVIDDAYLTYTITGLTNNVQYDVRLFAHGYYGDRSPASNILSGTPLKTPGAPTISGTAQVGETLTVDITGIADADGLKNATFTYQWLADDANIQGATNSTYTLADSDEGKTIKVWVSFTDDVGNQETLTSAADGGGGVR